MHATLPLLAVSDFPPLSRRRLETLQVNLGYRCNQSCLHCHVAAGPNRTEAMDGDTAALGAAGAVALAERMLGHTLAAAAAARPESIELCVTPDAGHPTFLRLQQARRLVMQEQGDGDLGARMARAFARVLHSHERALLIGTDAPALDATLLRHAAAALDGHDAVFVPALDGGYALVGLRSPQPALFADIAWSTSQVMAATRERLRAAGLRWTELSAVADIDEPADLVHLPPGWLE